MDAPRRRPGGSQSSQRGHGISSRENPASSTTPLATSRRGAKDRNNPVYLSAEEIDFHEAKREVDSPRTLEACRLEGIYPNELTYK